MAIEASFPQTLQARVASTKEIYRKLFATLKKRTEAQNNGAFQDLYFT